MAYATKKAVEGVLGRTLSDSEASALPALLAAVDAFINSETGRSFDAAEEQVTRYYDVERSRILDVDAFVMDDDHELEVFYVDADENKVSDVDDSDFEARPRNEAVKTYLQRRSSNWGTGCPSSVTNIAVKAYFGADCVPSDIAYAAAWLAAQAVGATDSLSLKSESIEGYSRTFADASKSSPLVQQTFAKYHEVLL
jgi:hypothetical protein